MGEIDWGRKLTSRKFWLAVVGLVSGLLMAFKVDAETVETICGVIMSAASVIAYIINEGLVDAAATQGKHEESNVIPLYGEFIGDKEE